MRCSFCKSDPEVIVMVPGRGMFGGAIEVSACLECAIKQDIYCRLHRQPHTGFSGDETACLACIEADVRDRGAIAETTNQRLFLGLPSQAWIELHEAAEISGSITGEDDSIAVLRFILTKSHRLKVPMEDVIDQVLNEGSASSIMPSKMFA